MKNYYFLMISGMFLVSAQFENFYAELCFAFVGGIGIGLAIRQAKKKAYNQGFEDGRNL
ncbi:hypothetical protein N9K95_03680 [Schleiferiaceae bacterium]|nr:hypothetical protein [Schleiferiaceae bacterium]MDA9964025.1 hypothetical protein [Schleiferiaceae bacterium]